MEFITSVDTNILWWIQDKIACPFLDTAMTVITHLGDAGAIWVLIGVALLFNKKYKSAGIILLLSLIGCLVFSNILLKPLVSRLRPAQVHSSFLLLIPMPHGFSFPSSHAMSSFSGATAIYLYNKKLGIFALILAALIAFSRLYLFVHYPSDVIAGAALGIITAIMAKKLVGSFGKQQ